MARKILKRWMPDPSKVREMKALQFLGDVIHDPNLFHLNRHSVSVAFFFGIFIAFLPIPGQMILAAVASIIFHCNLPITVALVWISNPITMAPLFFATYKFGTWLLGTPIEEFHFEMSWSWLREEVMTIWQPLLVGSLLTGIISGTLGYLSMQAFWRWQVVRHWNKRKKLRENPKA
ncbi:DUF2062 domain-containing protein [Marinibactrum halimedae]|uniref:DUF2062 domain-containing protein n=1 Tax=Marinibactrum halimedae TaxID=1444977 RepID=A0AA37T3V8_9GAMM|nr:DUF2062 domain-containing protein [Marinibactrum halimedae]MCD9460055.1 DUF2062 domain-containing protein [Marinibactrum halimedae]GLS26453.1 hypothetical protein GCM10007877_21690 [Marinibactrum halimedae]